MATSLGAAFVGALIAETLKGGILVGLLRYQRAEINGVSDGVVYGAMVGLGFALVSNLFAYVQAERSGLNALAWAIFQRGLLTPLWDPLFSAMIGLGVATRPSPVAAGPLGHPGGRAAVLAAHPVGRLGPPGPGRTAVVYVIMLGAFAVLLVAMVRDRPHRRADQQVPLAVRRTRP